MGTIRPQSRSANTRLIRGAQLIALLGILVASSGCGFQPDCLTASPNGISQCSPLAGIETRKIVLSENDSFAVDRGYLIVPENRQSIDSATIRVGFYRLKSTSRNPGTPIFVLPGGPGSSWIEQIESVAGTDGPGTAAQRRFFREHFFEDLRSVADVVIVDQRGAGISEPRMACGDRTSLPLEEAVTFEGFAEAAKAFTDSCTAELLAAGRDMSGYTIFELTDDVNALREALGYERISVFAGSFGSQWGLALISRYESTIDRFVFWGLEGLDHAYDSPTGVMSAMSSIFDEVAPGMCTQSDGAPPFSERLSATLESIRASPHQVLPEDRQRPIVSPVYFGAPELQVALYGAGDFSIRNRATIASWSSYAVDLLSGRVDAAIPIVIDFKQLNNPKEPAAQYFSIDCGLGVSERRRELLARDPALPLIGDINMAYDAVCGHWPAIDVGDRFRSPGLSDVPGLLIHGTWDVSTPSQNAAEVARLFPNSRLVTVERATHNILKELYAEKPTEFRPLVRAFLRGDEAEIPSTIVLPQIKACE